MAAQQTEGHFKDHPGPLDKYKIWNKNNTGTENKTKHLNTFPSSLENSVVPIIICVCEQTQPLFKKYTEDAGHEAERELWGEESEEPGRCVKARADLVLLEVIVQLAVVVV